MSVLPDAIFYIRQALLATILGVSRPTIDAWEKAGILLPRVAGAYTVVDVVEGVIVTSVRSAMGLTRVKAALDGLREEGVLEPLTEELRTGVGLCDLVVDPDVAEIALCRTDAALLDAIRGDVMSRSLVVVQAGPMLRRAVKRFWVDPEYGVPAVDRKPGRPRKTPADVIPLRSG